MAESRRAHGVLPRGALGVVFLVSLAVLFTPGGDVPSAPAGVDKLVHGALFLSLAVTGRWAGVPVVPLAVLGSAYAAVSEIVQSLAPLERTGSVADALADVAGLLLGLGLWAIASRPARRGR